MFLKLPLACSGRELMERGGPQKTGQGMTSGRANSALGTLQVSWELWACTPGGQDPGGSKVDLAQEAGAGPEVLSVSKSSGLLYLFLLQEVMKVSDGSLLGDPGRTPLSKKEGVKWQRPRLTRQALMRCCLVKWILSSAAPQGSGRGWGWQGGGQGWGWGKHLFWAPFCLRAQRPPWDLDLCLDWEMMFSFIRALPHSSKQGTALKAGPMEGDRGLGPCWGRPPRSLGG